MEKPSVSEINEKWTKKCTEVDWLFFNPVILLPLLHFYTLCSK